MKRWILGSLVGLSLGACGRDSLVDSFGCPEYQLVCDGVCTDVSRDASNCGTCGAECDADEQCLAGRCRDECDERETLCADGCVDILANDDNCGSCGNECGPGRSCVDGDCTGMGCGPGLQRCGDACVDTSEDPDHCGECFVECGEGMRCENNTCESGCGQRTDCNGRCVNLQSNKNNCGGCGIRCDEGQTCDGGVCSGCPEGLVRCGEACVDLQTDPDHCGLCNSTCASDQLCSLGVCDCSGPNLSVCDGQCVDVSVDPNHCGGCNSVCEDGACAGGTCCASPDVACGDECVDLLSSNDNCGSCFDACTPGSSCIGGACYFIECPAGYTLCNDECVDIEVDSANCGGCGYYCASNAICEAGSCTQVCDFPDILCDDVCTNAATDAENCGSCGYACDEGLVCQGGVCTDPGESCDFSNLEFPMFLNGGISVADITADDDCNLYVGMQSGSGYSGLVYKVDPSIGYAQVIAEFSNRVRGLVYRPTDGLLYGTSLDRLVSVGTDGADPQTFDESNTGEYLNGMTLSPDNWGGRDGYFVVGRSTGDVVMYDPESLLPEVFLSVGSPVSDVEFSGKQLYLAVHDANEILKVTPSGSMSTFTTLPCSPDGLTVEPGVRLFASCADESSIYAIDLETGEYSWVAGAVLSGSWAPSGLLWHKGVLFVVEESYGLNAVFL